MAQPTTTKGEEQQPDTPGTETRLVLSPNHRDLIEKSAISPEVARERGYRTVHDPAELEKLGFSRNQCLVPGLLIPLFNVWGEKDTCQLRPDNPRIKDDKEVKYETPKGAFMKIDVPPRCHPAIGDPNIDLFITEGVRKADSAASQGLCCVALLGVWNWRGKNNHGGTTALPDWEMIALKGRKVYIVFDSDVMVKDSVFQSLRRLKGFLESRGANVFPIYLPEVL